MKPIIALLSQYGRLGNRLWTYANVLAYGMKHNFSVHNPSFYNDSRFFSGINENNILKEVLPIFSRINDRISIFDSIKLDNGYLLDLDHVTSDNLCRKYIVFLHGFYFSAPECLNQFSTQIRSYFTPKDAIIKQIHSLIYQARKQCDILIGVHVRHGDYKEFCDGIMYYNLQEYVAIMRLLKEQCPHQTVSFIVCSDEYQDLSSYSDLQIYQGHGGVIQDLYTLAHCDFIVGPNSTFSHWSSFWGKVPLHILNYKAEYRYGFKPLYNPQLNTDFQCFNPQSFGRYAKVHVTLDEIFKGN